LAWETLTKEQYFIRPNSSVDAVKLSGSVGSK